MNLCRLCQSSNTRTLFNSTNIHGRHIINKHESFVVNQCIDCTCVFLSGIKVNKEYYSKYYRGIDDYYLEDKKSISLTNFLLSWWQYFSLKNKENFILNNSQRSNGKLDILDVGCGTGTFLEKLDNNKFNKFGLEIDERGYVQCLKKKLNVYNDEITNINFNKKQFHIITLWHVLEHLDKPIEVFLKISKLLKENGALMFATPNNNALGFKIGKTNWFHLDSPRHLILYNIDSINYICKKTGFKIVAIKNEFYDYPLDLFWSVRKNPIKIITDPFYPVFKFLSKEHLTFICKKK